MGLSYCECSWTERIFINWLLGSFLIEIVLRFIRFSVSKPMMVQYERASQTVDAIKTRMIFFLQMYQQRISFLADEVIEGRSSSHHFVSCGAISSISHWDFVLCFAFLPVAMDCGTDPSLPPSQWMVVRLVSSYSATSLDHLVQRFDAQLVLQIHPRMLSLLELFLQPKVQLSQSQEDLQTARCSLSYFDQVETQSVCVARPFELHYFLLSSPSSALSIRQPIRIASWDVVSRDVLADSK